MTVKQNIIPLNVPFYKGFTAVLFRFEVWCFSVFQTFFVPNNAWCDQHHIPLSSFYNAVTKLRKNACAIPESTAPSDNSYTLDFTSHQDVARVGIGPIPEAAGVHMAVSDFGTSHTIEFMMGEVQMEISNSVGPDLPAMIFQLLKEQPCRRYLRRGCGLYRLRQNRYAQVH